MSKKNYCDVQYTHFIWTVKYPNLSLGCDIHSPNFSIDNFGNTRFYVRVFSEKEDDNCNYVTVYLVKHEKYCGPNSIAFSVKFYASNNDKDDYFAEDTVNFKNRGEVILESCASFKKRKEYSPEGFLTVRLEIEPKSEDTDDEDDLYVCNQKELEMLSSDLNRVLKTKRFCDLTFRSIEGTKSIVLHKCILAARYPNLATELDISGKATREYNLSVDFDSISMLTQYLYSGSIDTGRATFGLHDILRRAELDHLEHVLYPTPRIIHASTSVKSKYGSLIWIIPKFSSLQQGKLLVNTLCLDIKLKWTKLRVLLYIRENAEEEECLALKIVRVEHDSKMYMLCTISFVGDEDGNLSKSYEHIFRTEREWNILCFAKRKLIEEERDSLLSGDTLKLRLEFIISDLIETSEFECVRCLEIQRSKFSVVAMNLWALQRDLKSLYYCPTHCDCTIRVNEELMPAHKVILSARSLEFSKMLEEGTEESESGQIVMKGFDAGVVKIMLYYIYCGELPQGSEQYMLHLYEAGHKYQVKQLTEKCARIMGSNLEVCAVGEALTLADLHDDKHLKECVKNFVSRNADEVFESKEWEILKRERIDLTAGIMNAVLGSAE